MTTEQKQKEHAVNFAHALGVSSEGFDVAKETVALALAEALFRPESDASEERQARNAALVEGASSMLGQPIVLSGPPEGRSSGLWFFTDAEKKTDLPEAILSAVRDMSEKAGFRVSENPAAEVDSKTIAIVKWSVGKTSNLSATAFVFAMEEQQAGMNKMLKTLAHCKNAAATLVMIDGLGQAPHMQMILDAKMHAIYGQQGGDRMQMVVSQEVSPRNRDEVKVLASVRASHQTFFADPSLDRAPRMDASSALSGQIDLSKRPAGSVEAAPFGASPASRPPRAK